MTRISRWIVALAALALTSLLVPAHGTVPLATGQAEAACSPPCGYIDPLINIDLPDKPVCRDGYRVDQADAHEDCIALMADGESISYEGTMLFYWEMSNEGTYPNNPQEDIVISFGGTGSNPDWISVAVEPSEFVLGTVELFHPDNIKQEEGESGQRIWFWFERDITVTLARDGEPTGEEVESILNRNGIRPFLLKAESTSSGDRFREGFGIEEFRFDAREEPAVFSARNQESPSVALPLLAAGVLAAAVVIRRRT